MTRPFVVFGYGSLIFKPPPHVIKQTPGFLKGYVRRFAQKSHDHRGTLENPGRVVTLIYKEDWDKFSQSVGTGITAKVQLNDPSSKDPFPHEDVVWGIAFTIDPVYAAEVRDTLDYREKDGYTREFLDIYGINSDAAEVVIMTDALCYVGRNDNPSFVGPEPLHQLARTIFQSVGPSGPNKDYLYQLAESIRQLSPNSFDSHLFALEKIVRGLDDTSTIRFGKATRLD